MESFQDQGIVLSIRPHGENGAIVNLMTQGQGRACGYVRGARSSKMRGTLEPGNIVDANWQSRVADGLGTYTLELSKSHAASFMQDPLRLGALQSACALVDAALPEREAHAGLYHGLCALFDVLEQDIWGAAYVMWEIAFLKELGFSLDLSKCAGGGDDNALAYVSPKTGRAVSYEAGAPYRDKLLALPGFLKPRRSNTEGVVRHLLESEQTSSLLRGSSEAGDVYTGLQMTGYFLEHWVFNHHTKGVPDPRLLFEERFAKTVVHTEMSENVSG